MHDFSLEEMKAAVESVAKLKEKLDQMSPENIQETLCGYCHLALNGSGSWALDYQNPRMTRYHSDCMTLLRAYENSFALRKLYDRNKSKWRLRRALKKESDKAYRWFAKTYIEYCLRNGIDMGYALIQVLSPLGEDTGKSYDEIVGELEKSYSERGWGPLRKEKKE